MRDLNAGETQVVNLDGIFVQIGVPNAAWLQDAVELNGRGEVVIDRDNAQPSWCIRDGRNRPENKQIIISMGAGAN